MSIDEHCMMKPADRAAAYSRSLGLLMAIGWLIAPVPAPAEDIYGYTDDVGVVHLSNVVNDEADVQPYQLWLRIPSGPGAAGQSVYDAEIAAAAREFGLEPNLLQAVITAESNHNPTARSPKGAMGLMQLMPETSRRLGVIDPWRPADNIRGGARYLSELLNLFDQDLPLALAAYNAGEQSVLRYGRQVPPYPETRNYVTRVLTLYRKHSTAGKASKGKDERHSM